MPPSLHTPIKIGPIKVRAPYVNPDLLSIDYILPNRDNWYIGTYMYVQSYLEHFDAPIKVLCILYYDIAENTWGFNLLQGSQYNFIEKNLDIPSIIKSFPLNEVPEIYTNVYLKLLEVHDKKDWPEPEFTRIH